MFKICSVLSLERITGMQSGGAFSFFLAQCVYTFKNVNEVFLVLGTEVVSVFGTPCTDYSSCKQDNQQ